MLNNNVNLKQKIIDLFNYRFLPGILDLVEVDATIREQYVEKLIVIQEAIYHLDHVLESEWEIINARLGGKWKAIFHSLHCIGIEEHQLEEYCRHIFKYQKHELDQRQGKPLLRLSLEYFYFYKSCDVKLLRRLIYDNYPSLKSLMPLSEWRWFDLVTEVNDDVMDLYEDIDTNNGNYFLLSIEKYGMQKAYQNFHVFLKNIGKTFDRKIKEKNTHPVIIELTFRELKKTMELLDLRKSELSVNPIIANTLDSV